MIKSKLCLGGAQLGLDYGIANKGGRMPGAEALRILSFAHRSGVDSIDTAYLYGESEKIIGEYLSGTENGFKIISKLPDLSKPGADSAEKYFSITLQRLRKKKIYGYLVHSFGDIISDGNNIWQALEGLKRKGLVEKIGVSVYKTDELDYLQKNGIRFDIIQLPYNIFDRRFERYFDALKREGVEIYSRSAFLQGLFFVPIKDLNDNFRPAKDALGGMRQLSEENSIPVNALCLCFSAINPFIDKVILGVDSVEQLEKNVISLEYSDKVRDIYDLLKPLELSDEQVLLPYNWKL